MGEIGVEVSFKDKKARRKLITIDKTEIMSSMGRDMMNKLNIFVKGINELQIVDCKINNLIKKYKEVFNNKLAKYNG